MKPREPRSTTRSRGCASWALSAALGHRDPPLLLKALTEMFLALRTRNLGEEDAAATVAIYAGLLADQPVFAVVKACRRAAYGGGPSLAFAPTAAELIAMAATIAEPYFAERADLAAILGAVPAPPLPDDAAKARVAALAAAFRGGRSPRGGTREGRQ